MLIYIELLNPYINIYYMKLKRFDEYVKFLNEGKSKFEFNNIDIISGSGASHTPTRLNDSVSTTELKFYNIIIPPESKKECVNILLKDFKNQLIEYGDDAQMYFNTSNKPYGEEELKNGKLEIEMNKLDLHSLQHEVIHYIQGKKYPEMFKGAPKGEKFWSTIFDVTDSHKKYLSLPYEIMAYAFNEIKKPKGHNPLKNKNTFISKSDAEKYEGIGGKVFELFKVYVEKYREYYK